MNQQRKENDSRIYFTINLHGSMAPGRGRTCDPWTASQTRILGHTAVVKMSGNILGRTAQSLSGSRYVSDCRSRVREFDPGPVPYFQGDCRSWNINFYDHSLPSTDLRRVFCQFQAKEYVQEVLVNC